MSEGETGSRNVAGYADTENSDCNWLAQNSEPPLEDNVRGLMLCFHAFMSMISKVTSPWLAPCISALHQMLHLPLQLWFQTDVAISMVPGCCAVCSQHLATAKGAMYN